jgi:protein-L-isoaspartate O-methyltransferase
VSAHPLVVAARAVGVRDARVLDAVAAVPRACYVPQAASAKPTSTARSRSERVR